MSNLLSSREIIVVLLRHGFVQKSQKGSHVKFVKADKTVIVPHPRPSIPIGTFHSIIRQAGLKKDDFLS